MTEFTKWVWLILILILFLGKYVFVVLAVELAAYALVRWLKPEWLDKF